MEEVKRLTPKPEVLRELFLKSGNVCAFPDCLHPIVNTNGVYVAQLCHIEAANEGGQRFNKLQSNNDRRQFENLLLMCHRHHKETDDVKKYTVDILKSIKRNHESKFEKVLDSLANDVYDVALAYQPKIPTSINSLLRDEFIVEKEVDIFLSELEQLISSLNKISPVTRKIFVLIVNRADPEYCQFSLNEFQYVVSMNANEAYNHVAILEQYGLLYNNQDSEIYERKLCISNLVKDLPYPLAMILKEHCEKNCIDLSTLFVDLNFESLE